jgi:hypothetical protein
VTGRLNDETKEADEIEVTLEMIEAAVDVLSRRFLEVDNPENFPSLCREVLHSALSVRPECSRRDP